MKIYHHIYSIYYIRQAILYLKSQASAFALFTASTESGKVGFGIRWRTLPIWIRSHSAEYKADLIPASTNWILEMQNRLYIMQICKFVKEKYYANILIYSIKSNVQKNGLAIFMHICLIFEYLKKFLPIGIGLKELMGEDYYLNIHHFALMGRLQMLFSSVKV